MALFYVCYRSSIFFTSCRPKSCTSWQKNDKFCAKMFMILYGWLNTISRRLNDRTITVQRTILTAVPGGQGAARTVCSAVTMRFMYVDLTAWNFWTCWKLCTALTADIFHKVSVRPSAGSVLLIRSIQRRLEGRSHDHIFGSYYRRTSCGIIHKQC